MPNSLSTVLQYADDEVDPKDGFPIGVLQQLVRRNLRNDQIIAELQQYVGCISESTLLRRRRKYNLMRMTHDDSSAVWIEHIRNLANTTLLNRAELLRIANKMHHTQMSMSTFEKILQRNNIRLRNELSDAEVRMLCENAIAGPAAGRGYRMLQVYIKSQNRVHIGQRRIMEVLREIDPEGVKIRTGNHLRRREYVSHGPNDCWHFDGYDKLSRFGFGITGCVDGYSRKIIWYTVTPANLHRQAATTLSVFVQAVFRTGVLPRITCSDRGTENGWVAFVMEHESDSTRHMYVTSTRNTRIESFWGQARRMGMYFWINMFKTLAMEYQYDASDPVQRGVATFLFLPLIEQTMQDIARDWDLHRMRSTKYSSCPSGRPYFLYSDPPEGTPNCGVQIPWNFLVNVEGRYSRLRALQDLFCRNILCGILLQPFRELGYNTACLLPTNESVLITAYLQLLGKVRVRGDLVQSLEQWCETILPDRRQR